MSRATLARRTNNEEERVEALIGQIENQWADLRLAWRNAVARAVEFGVPLAEVKRLAPKRWHDVLDRFGIPEPTANLAIRLHENRQLVLAELDKNPKLTFNGARALLPRERGPGGGRKRKDKALESAAGMKALEEKRQAIENDDRHPDEPKNCSQAPEEASQSSSGEAPSVAIEQPEQSHPATINSTEESKEHPPWLDMPGLQAWEEGERLTKRRKEGLTIAQVAEKEELEPQFVRHCLQVRRLPKDLLVEATLGEALEEEKRRQQTIEEDIENASPGTKITQDGTLIPPEEQTAGEGKCEPGEQTQNDQDVPFEEVPEKKFADACWVAEDITSNYDCTTEQAEEWLGGIDCKLRDHMIEAGWEYIDLTCPFERTEDEDDDSLDVWSGMLK